MLNNIYFVFFLSFLLAAAIVFFQYLYKIKTLNRSLYLPVILRFIAIFGIFLLLFNPKVSQRITENIKPKLILLSDNSESVSFLKQDSIVKHAINELRSDQELNKHFELHFYTFGEKLRKNDHLTFNENETRIYTALYELNKLYKKETAPVILLTDGNQTFGNDISFYRSDQPVFPVVLGDTTAFTDLKISEVNVNKYTYLKNKFPVEVFASYSGSGIVNTSLQILSGNKVIQQKKLVFDPENRSQKIDFKLRANSVGKHFYKVRLIPLDQEKNISNNTFDFTIDVLDQRTNVLLVYNILHPDIGFWKKTVESNGQRELKAVRISDFSGNPDDFQFVIFYQPDPDFKKLFADVLMMKINFLIQTGTDTDWSFINQHQPFLKKQITGVLQDVEPEFNEDFSVFQSKSLDFDKFPPLKNQLGKVIFKSPSQTLLFQKFNAKKIKNPLLITIDDQQVRGIFLFGEDIFKWRGYSYVLYDSFKKHDDFFNGVFQYLQNSDKKSRLEVNYEPISNSNKDIRIIAKAYDANYIFDENAVLDVIVNKKGEDNRIKLPFSLKNGYFEVRIKDPEPGIYTFEVHSEGFKQKFKGKFRVLDYNREQQNIPANYRDLNKLALNSRGRVFMPDQINDLIKYLEKTDQYPIVQKQYFKLKSLIDWRWLLSLIIVSLSLEWFFRKYNGLT